MTIEELIERAKNGERIGNGDRQIAALVAHCQEVERDFGRFCGFAATCRKGNTDEWMRMLADWLNDAASRLEPGTNFTFDGDCIRQGVHPKRSLREILEPVQDVVQCDFGDPEADQYE